MSRFTDYSNAAATGAIELSWLLELASPTGELLATTANGSTSAIQWGAQLRPLVHQQSLFSGRGATLDVVVAAEQIEALIPATRGDLLDPSSSNVVRISAGLAGSDPWLLATMRIIESEVTRETGAALSVAVSLADALYALDTELASGFSWDEAETLGVVINRLAARVLPDPGTYNLPDIPGCDLAPGAAEAGENVRDLLEEFLAGCGWELASDEAGLIYSRPVPPVKLDPYSERWSYGAGAIPIKQARKVRAAHAPQTYRVSYGSVTDGNNADVVLVYDLDPRSQGYFAGEGEVRMEPVNFPWIRHNGQAHEAGYGRMRRESPGPGVIEFWSVPNPAMRLGDQVELNEPDLKATGFARVIGRDLPIHVDGDMRVTARFVWDPETAVDKPARRGQAWQTSFSDDFDRPDENLEQDPGGGGSPEWTEFGSSWGVESERAVQRFDRGWCLAVVNVPMKTLNHKATMTDIQIPTGRAVGPTVRGSGGGDGYAAVVSSAGVVSLEWWQALKKVATLGAYDAGGALNGSAVTTVALGNVISVEINGSEVLSVTDDRGYGTHVGMLGYGGWRPNYPSVGAFSAAEAT